MLSKSKYTRGTNCLKSLWLYVNKKEEQTVSEDMQRIFDRGTSVGELAQQYFPGGEMAMLEDYPSSISAKRTQELIERGVETIYEATFIYDETLVAVDILHKENGKWKLYEVKSTNSAKPEHTKDVAVQYFVVTGNGLPLEDAFLMHFNREYVRRGEIDVKQLFAADSLIKEVKAMQKEVKENIVVLKKMLEGGEPNVPMGLQCEKPYTCDFCDYCLKMLPHAEEEVVDLSSEPEVMIEEVREFVQSVKYPVYHLDFETIMPGLPLFDESRPYQQLPFQFSLHHQNTKGGEVFHEYYLAENDISVDPRKGLIEAMIRMTKPAETIFVYSIIFERTRVKEMMRDFPGYEKELQSIIDRMVDLIIPFRKSYYRTETMEGSSSIKKVLPALCPEFSYDELEIGNGMDASNAFFDLYYCDDDEVKKQTRENLLQYCHLDTLAMVKIFEVLQKV